MDKKRIYISGKIGENPISDATRKKFALAEKMLRGRGYDVFNPTCEEWVKELHKNHLRDTMQQPHGEKVAFYDYALLRDLMVLATCDAVYFLDDFTKSGGAGTEYSYALAIGRLQTFFQDADDAQCFANSEDFDKWRDVWLPIEAEEVGV